MARADILLDENYDMATASGDMVVGDSDGQNIDLLLGCTKNSFKESPTVGVGMIQWVKGQKTDLKSMRREINVQFEADGYKADWKVDDNGDLQIGYTPKY
jgi:hypothetical protein